MGAMFLCKQHGPQLGLEVTPRIADAISMDEMVEPANIARIRLDYRDGDEPGTAWADRKTLDAYGLAPDALIDYMDGLDHPESLVRLLQPICYGCGTSWLQRHGVEAD